MSDVNEFHVKPVLFIHSPNPMLGRFDRGPMGYLPMIFCPTKHGRSKILVSAINEVDTTWTDPEPHQVYKTPGEAMRVYEKAAPAQMPYSVTSRNVLSDETINEIHEKGLYRTISAKQSTVDDDDEEEMEIEF